MPGDPDDDEETPTTEVPATDPGHGPITRLPRTGAGDAGTTSVLMLVLAGGFGLIAAAAALSGRRRRANA